MIDISKMSDKELFELEKKLKEERSKRERYISYKGELYPHEKLRELFQNLYGVDTYEEVKDFDEFHINPHLGAFQHGYDTVTDSLCRIVDIVTGNCVIDRRIHRERRTTDFVNKRNTTVEGDLADRYAKVLDEIVDILLRESKETGLIKIKDEER